MKVFLLSVVLSILTTACSNRAQNATYDMLHERERQLCLQQGRMDCPRAESYKEYKQKRDEVIKR